MTQHFYRVGAFLSGLALILACVYVGGFLAALAIPKAYFALFGREHERLALVILDGLTTAVPFFLLSLVWCGLTLHGNASTLRVAAWCCLTGIVVGLVYVEVWSALELRAAEALSDPPSFFAYLWRVAPAWWDFPQILAFPGGLGVATVLIRRADRPHCASGQ